MSEYDEQATVIEWANLQERKYPELELLFAIPNGGHRGQRFVSKIGKIYPPLEAVRLKKQGVKPGIPDLMLPVARCGFFGLFLEMKDGTRPGATVNKSQRVLQEKLIAQKYLVVTCWNAGQAIDILKAYLTEYEVEKHIPSNRQQTRTPA